MVAILEEVPFNVIVKAMGNSLVESLKLRLSDFHEWSEKYHVANRPNAEDSPSIGSAERQRVGGGEGGGSAEAPEESTVGGQAQSPGAGQGRGSAEGQVALSRHESSEGSGPGQEDGR
jgi:hypothetical protein